VGKDDVSEKGSGPTKGGVLGVAVIPSGGGASIGGEGMRGFQAEGLEPCEEGEEEGF
jgi:hypothetical protein